MINVTIESTNRFQADMNNLDRLIVYDSKRIYEFNYKLGEIVNNFTLPRGTIPSRTQINFKDDTISIINEKLELVMIHMWTGETRHKFKADNFDVTNSSVIDIKI
jgi:hypothetical protein